MTAAPEVQHVHLGRQNRLLLFGPLSFILCVVLTMVVSNVLFGIEAGLIRRCWALVWRRRRLLGLLSSATEPESERPKGLRVCPDVTQAIHMAHLISFRTAKFDISKETPNPINPIAGQSVLNWLRDELAKAQYRSTEPHTEDWGWYIDVAGPAATYLVGASADADASGPDVEWIIQVHKHRSLTERLLGRNTMTLDDPLSTLIERIVRSHSGTADISVERGE